MTDIRRRVCSDILDVVPVSASFTLGPVNNAQVIQSTSATAITITLPNDLPVGFSCIVEQGGAGQVIFATATGAGLYNRQSFDRTAGQYAVVTLYARSNTTGRNAGYILGGDGA